MGEEYVILNKDKICFCSHSLTLPAVSALPVADSGKADGVSEAMPPNMVYPIASDSGFSPFKQQYNKKVFSFFTLTLALTLPAGKHPACWNSSIGCEQRFNVRIAMVYRE